MFFFTLGNTRYLLLPSVPTALAAIHVSSRGLPSSFPCYNWLFRGSSFQGVACIMS